MVVVNPHSDDFCSIETWFYCHSGALTKAALLLLLRFLRLVLPQLMYPRKNKNSCSKLKLLVHQINFKSVQATSDDTTVDLEIKSVVDKQAPQ